VEDASALSEACRLVGDRWSLPIVAALQDGPLRYTEIRELLPAIAPNILSARLRSLEQDGLLASQRYSARPPRFEYRLTGDGEALRDIARMLAAWGARRSGAGQEAVHESCGSALEMRWWCPACAAAVVGPSGEDEEAIPA